MRTVDLNVCQGIGDCFWVYQLFAPHVDAINFHVLYKSDGDAAISMRAYSFLRLLPKVRSVTGKLAAPGEYKTLAHGRFTIADCLASGGDYACNDLLEHGTRIEAIALHGKLEETVAIRTKQTRPHPIPGKFNVLYVSGGTLLPDVIRDVGIWDVHQWIEFSRAFYGNRPRLPLVILGAEYDRAAALKIAESLRGIVDCRLVINRPAAEVCFLLSRCELFIGYQSGLNVIADQFDRRQVMLYFPALKAMPSSWPKRRNIDAGRHHVDFFDRTPQEVLGEIPWN